MWAATPTTLSWSPVTGNRGPFTVSGRNNRPRKNINYDYDEEEDEEINNKEHESEILNQQEETIGDLDVTNPNPTKISGSAVLLALQKASAQKTLKKKKKKKQSNYTKEEERSQGNVIGDVKALCIKSDWKDRLDELESQINEFIHS